MLGNWKGSYCYENDRIRKIIGYDQTEFEIVIEEFDGKTFSGKVTDDEKSGGMKETGKIIGRIENDEIYFEKSMPKNCQIININGDRKYSEKSHPIIYYSGKFSDNGNGFEGNWKFKKRLGFLFYVIPIIYSPGKGTWKMEPKELPI
ncbi:MULTISPECIES: hypothetical protein [Flavobacterium]|uniref:Uncharacterized protein n=1 Tax=Flavobacterium sedimenticola TaxID=3043286 RepID=A0ABT6XNV6_9FLAO|nr:hypothetical protein [Flavobacterium sedimenticola]MDI9256756.1 hypothetical protein [Flavobacterium sedimenticola]